MLNNSALDVQVDGNHYKKMRLQPIELAYLVGGTPCFTKLAKYATRDKGNKAVDLDKAIHCIKLEQDIVVKSVTMVKNSYPILKETGKVEGSAEFERACHWIDIFTEDKYIRSALKYMLVMEYSLACESIKLLKEEVCGK